MGSPELRIRSWSQVSDDQRHTGLLGYLSIEYGDLVLDGITLRRTSKGRFALSFPARTDRSGRRHPYVRPIDDQTRKDIEAQIIWALGEREVRS